MLADPCESFELEEVVIAVEWTYWTYGLYMEDVDQNGDTKAFNPPPPFLPVRL